MHLYRIAQEAINNATKHGKAANVLVSLIDDGKMTTLRIADDGTGISKTANGSDGMGLGLMYYRARLVGEPPERVAAIVHASKSSGVSMVNPPGRSHERAADAITTNHSRDLLKRCNKG
jgi:signal transduction histidine kinase